MYVVSVNATAGHFPSMTEMGNEAPIYHPSSPREAAAEVVVASGAEIQGIDIRHRVERGHSISGTTTGAVEGVRGSLMVLLRNAATGQLETFTQSGNPSFAFFAVPDGEYELTALQTSFGNQGNDQGLSASTPRRVAVRGASVAGVELRLAKLGSIAGRVVIERMPAAACLSPSPVRVESVLLSARENRPETQPLRIGFALSAFGEMMGEGAPEANGEFRLPNLQAGRYRIETNLPHDALYLRGIALSVAQPSAGAAKKTDAARSPINLKTSEKLTGIEIAVAEGAAAVSGRVVAGEGQRLPKRMLVHLIPAEAAADDVPRYREAGAGEDGAFAFAHLAPGKYWLLARAITESETNKDGHRPAAPDPAERARLRREAEAAKNEITLAPCQRAKDVTVKTGIAGALK